MSFGFSVGDILGGANLAYNLCKSLSAAKGSAREYSKLIKELDTVHKVLLQVEQLRESNQLRKETLNALLFTVNTTNEAMEDFMIRCKAYKDSLRPGGSGNIWKDGWMKGKWSVQMPNQTQKYPYDNACFSQLPGYADLPMHSHLHRASVEEVFVPESMGESLPPLPDYPGIRLKATLFYDRKRDNSSSRTDIASQQLYSDFQLSRDVGKFFRCGQVFSIQITSDISFEKGSQTLVDVAQSPEHVTALQEKAKKLRLAQILSLPLVDMVQYSEESQFDQTMVWCRLCTRVAPATDSEHWMSKDYWASEHFRWQHWKYFYPMIMDRERLPRKIPGSDSKDSHASPLSISRKSSRDTFSPESWLKLEGITSWYAIGSDADIEDRVAGGSQNSWWHCDGPTMIRRFVVIKEGPESCLCLGIHTYAGQGCKDQPDQELFSVVHSSKVPPKLGGNEANVKLLPIRMSAHHPSTFLPLSARMHFGRVYEISHKIPARPLGLIDTDYMELLISQFEKVTRQKNDSEDLTFHHESNAVIDTTLVEEIRQNILKVLGPDVHLTAPEEETVAPEKKKRRL
ncbi:uncharacterized protein LY89DRAFT_787539 [Mollisia scopiformis]|uniref:DUF6590 domain-containing protein n=1 Tax=Mollisia scopiformis TaxID=149040 RepID=A0A132BDS3_MOLSC|nr:uncharacterized protein LY89DRAFT_787539 [Mollisia scopiformis]KUJ10528.1 hypothetical protein LY89DRAFT_787539 [Mollisia scopiformis]